MVGSFELDHGWDRIIFGNLVRLKSWSVRLNCNRRWPNPGVSKTNFLLLKSPGGNTPSLDRSRPCLTTIDKGRVHPQNLKKTRYRPPDRWWSNPGVSKTNFFLLESPGGSTPSLDRSCPRLSTTGHRTHNDQNRKKTIIDPETGGGQIPERPKQLPFLK